MQWGEDRNFNRGRKTSRPAVKNMAPQKYARFIQRRGDDVNELKEVTGFVEA